MLFGTPTSLLSCFLIKESFDTLLWSLFEFFVINLHAGYLFVSSDLLVHRHAVGFHLFFHLLFAHAVGKGQLEVRIDEGSHLTVECLDHDAFDHVRHVVQLVLDFFRIDVLT